MTAFSVKAKQQEVAGKIGVGWVRAYPPTTVLRNIMLLNQTKILTLETTSGM